VAAAGWLWVQPVQARKWLVRPVPALGLLRVLQALRWWSLVPRPPSLRLALLAGLCWPPWRITDCP